MSSATFSYLKSQSENLSIEELNDIFSLDESYNGCLDNENIDSNNLLIPSQINPGNAEKNKENISNEQFTFDATYNNNNNNNNNNSIISTTQINQVPIIDFNDIPISIINYFKLIKSTSTDYSFVRNLSAQMCKEFLPMYYNIVLKMTLLLSIASIQESNRKQQSSPPIPIIVIGRDSSTINLIMNHMGNYAKRFIIAPLENFISNENKYVIHKQTFQANPILLATHGVLYAGDWIRLSTQNSNHIQRILDSGKIILDKSNICYPLECSIWSHWYCIKPVQRDCKTFSMFLNLFGIPIVLQDDPVLEEMLADFILEKVTIDGQRPAPIDDFNITYNDMKKYLSVVGNREMQMTADAKRLLDNYFIVTRTNRSGTFSQRGFIVLKQFAESYAKLSLRNFVLECDIIAAISIVENYISGFCGNGLITVPDSIFSLEEVDIHMSLFEKSVREYIDYNINFLHN